MVLPRCIPGLLKTGDEDLEKCHFWLSLCRCLLAESYFFTR